MDQQAQTSPSHAEGAESSLLKALLPAERLVVELLAVFSEGAPVTPLTRALGRLGLRSAGRTPTNEDTHQLLRGLAARGLISGTAAYTIPDGLAHVARVTLAQEGRLLPVAEVVREFRPASKSQGGPPSTWSLAVRELRIELYARRWDAARALLPLIPRHSFYDLCQPFDRAWVEALPADLRSHALAGIVESATTYLVPADEAFEMLTAQPQLNDGEHRILVENLVLRGRLDEAERRILAHPSLESDVASAWLLLLRGHTAASVAAYEAALKAYHKLSGARGGLFPDRAGQFFVVALIAADTPASLARATALTTAAQRKKAQNFERTYGVLAEVLELLAGRIAPPDLIYLNGTVDLARRDMLELLLQAAAGLWTKVSLPGALLAELEKRRASAEQAGLRWYAAQAADLLAGLTGKAAAPELGVPGARLSSLVSLRERWADTLDALLEIAAARKPGPKAPGPAAAEPDHRLIWLLRKTGYGMELEPREQTRAKGTWSKGRPVALKRLFEEGQALDFLTAADRAACATILSATAYEYFGRYPRINYTLDTARALRALAGSGQVFIDVPGEGVEPCEIRQSAPRLEVTRTGDRQALALVPQPLHEKETLTLLPSGPRAVEIVEFSPIHHAIARALGQGGLEVPQAGEARLRAVLGALSESVVVHGDLADGAGARAVPGDPRPRFLLRALGEGLSVAACVRPLGAKGPVARPGQGGAVLLAQVSGRHARAARDLPEETRRLEAALAACPVLAAHRSADADFVLPDREQALEVLLELRALGEAAAIEWPDGEALAVSEPVEAGQLSVVIREKAGGFQARGVLQLPGRPDLDLIEVIDYLSASPGRFVRLGQEERYLALSAALREQIDELLGYSERAGSELRIHPLAAPLIDDLLAASRVDADAAWRRQVERFTVGAAEPEVPSTLRAELRPYQVEGFRWMARLSRWGAGGCLADDMGLGKTVQAIALLLLRAPEGPGLVVAPTSVVPNWVDEVQRFAPTLRVRTFAGPARGKDLTELGPFDLVVTSYSILQLDIAVLEQVLFTTAVLDEAQGIKNAETRRAKAAGRLRAQLRLATTGTPIENRLDDLHSIFSFLNPGLLGTPQRFQTRFGRPIERDHDLQVRNQLRRLVSPFVLRRSKTQVLPELPSRTEVTLRVPLELEEAALYEAIRQKALGELEGAADTANAGARRLQILAAIIRLRQAASNARLVLPDSQAPSAKLAALGELLDDLLPNHHKLLVFSQFVGHLALVREMLEARGVSYQYLDGSTPMAARKLAIDSFQGGQGDVFLISLKAGGFGLNLTAADYVVHMDPWWNPAVEDQASDRAHRIGQSRPVTIYRLVARDTIEDRILGLHHRKRELAAGILEGSDLAGSMSEADLLALIRDAG